MYQKCISCSHQTQLELGTSQALLQAAAQWPKLVSFVTQLRLAYGEKESEKPCRDAFMCQHSPSIDSWHSLCTNVLKEDRSHSALSSPKDLCPEPPPQNSVLRKHTPKSMFIKEHTADLRRGSGAWHGCNASFNPEICGQHSSGPREMLSFLPALCPPNERQLDIIPDRAGGFFLKEQDEGSFGRARGVCSGWSSGYNQARMPLVRSGVCGGSHIQR